MLQVPQRCEGCQLTVSRGSMTNTGMLLLLPERPPCAAAAAPTAAATAGMLCWPSPPRASPGPPGPPLLPSSPYRCCSALWSSMVSLRLLGSPAL